MLNYTVGILVHNTNIEQLSKTLSSVRLAAKDIPVFLASNCADPAINAKYADLSRRIGVQFLGVFTNNGFGAGHNEIVKRVETDWYICCNPDIEVNADTFDKMLSIAEQKGSNGLVTCKILNEDGTVQPLARRHLSLPRWIHRQLWRVFPRFFLPYECIFDYGKTQNIEFVTGCFFGIRTEIYKQLGGFDEDFFIYCEDADLARRAEKFGPNLYVAEASAIHSWGKAWKSSWFAIKHEVRSLLIYFQKHGWF